MSRVREVTPKVIETLKKHPETRSDDKLLIMSIYHEYYHVGFLEPWGLVMKRKDLPSFESIRRARQRAQEYCEDLRAEEPVESIRISMQEDYIAYARGE